MRVTTSLPAIVVLGLLIAACSPGPAPSPTPTATEASTPGMPTATGAAGGETAAPSLASQTDTEWGRIWDALPASFPSMAGTQIATDTGAGASSGQLTVPAARDEVVQFYRQALRDAGYSIGTDGPLEDGSVTVTATDGYQCRMELSVRGTGARESMVTVLYGAGCPFE